MPPAPADDPVRARRAGVARGVKLAKRFGYLCWLVAMVLVVVAVTGDLDEGLTVAATVFLVAGVVVLAPAIILGYAVNAAERDDRARGR